MPKSVILKNFRVVTVVAVLMLPFTSGWGFSAGEERIRFKQVFNLKCELNGAFLKDREGFIWIGTAAGGVIRYDGYELKQYKAGPDTLSDNWVVSLAEDKEGIIWLGTKGGGVTAYDKKNGTYRQYRHHPDDPDSLSSDSLPYTNQTIFEDKSGTIWIGTQGGGLNRFDKQNGRFIHYKHNPNDANSLSNDKVNAVIEDKDGILWIGTEEGGLNRFDGKNGTWTHYKHNPNDESSLSDNNVLSIIEDRDGILWIGTEKGGLNRFDRDSGTFVSYNKNSDNPEGIGDDRVFYIYEDGSGKIWLCHYLGKSGIGLDLFTKETETFVHYTGGTGSSHGLSSNSVSCIFEDRETGILWVVHDSGPVDKYDRNAQKFTLWQHDPNNSNSLSNNGVTKIFEDSNGFIWIATAYAGLNKFDRKTGEFTGYPAEVSGFPSQWITSILEDGSGNFWVGAQDVLTLFDRETGKVSGQYANEPDNPHSFTRCKSIRSIIEDKDDPNVIWIGTHGGGLAALDKEQELFTTYRHDPENPGSLSDDVLRVIYDDGKGGIWVPTFNGLNRFDKKTEQFTRYFHNPSDPDSIRSDFFISVFGDSSGRIWIAGKGGISRFDEKTKSFKNYTNENGFPDTTFSMMREDEAGNLWISSISAGLIKFNPETESVRIYTEEDGLQGNGFWGDSVCKTGDGQMWFGGANGVNSFYPEDVTDNPCIPPVFLTEFKQGGIDLNLGTAPEKAREINLDWQNNFFEFKFAALNYTMPEKNRYAYMLEGVDKDWYYSGTNPFGRYTALRGGTYTLKLKGSNNDGIWNKEGRSIKITVTPPPWKTSWAYTLYVAAVFSMLFAYIRYQQYKIQRVKAEGEARMLANEMDTAKKIQTVLLPEKPYIPGYEIAASMHPADEVGGDYYDVISVGGYNWIIVGDVSGHGLTSGLVMMMVQTAIHTVLMNNPASPPSRLLSSINGTIYENIRKMDETKHMTIVVLAGGKDGRFSFSGLHEDILVRRAVTGKVEEIETDGFWIGMEPDISDMLKTDALILEPGDCMVLFTDGVTEARCEHGMFGNGRLVNIIEESGGRTAAEIHEDILEALTPCKKPDDVTLLVMRRL